MIDVVEAVGRRLGAQRPEWLDTAVPPRLDGAGRLDGVTSLDDLDLAVLAVTGAIEDDIRFGSAFAQLQQPLAARRPCVGLVGWLLADEKADTAEVHRRCHALVDRGLLHVDNPADPRAEWVLRPPVPVWDALTGSDRTVTLPEGLERRPATSFPDLAQLVLTPQQHALAQRLPDLVATGDVSALVVRGMRGTGRLTLLGAVARELGRDVLVLDPAPAGRGEDTAMASQRDEAWRLLAPLAELTHALPVVRLTAGPGAVAPLRAMPGLATALGVTLGRTGAVDGAPLARALTVELDGCRPEQRRALWQASPVPVDTADLERIAVSFVLPPGTIHRLRPLAGSAAVAAGRRQITVADVRAGCQVLSRQSLETHATRLDPLPADVAPVLAPLAAAELDALVTRCRRREDLGTALGHAVAGTVNRGVRALFSGPSGTGKTLAARTVAARLGLDVHRLDLAAVVNKYIGETERNLDEVLSRAEELGVVLLLDEGDALMTRRTDVGNANDRYANLETNFLLQRLETFEGIAIVTTNAGNRIDTAFLRRIDVTVDFAPPDAQQRLELWQLHLPTGHRVHADALADLARRCALTGGQIRNAVLHAALLALDRGTPIGDDDVVAAVRREYRRDGAAAPLR